MLNGSTRTSAVRPEEDGEAGAKAASPRIRSELLSSVRELVYNTLCCVRSVPDEEAIERAKKLAKQPKLRGILRVAQDKKKTKERVQWRTVLVGSEEREEDQRQKAQDEADERERQKRFEQWTKLARLPALTLEELLIPVRIAFPELTVTPPAAIVLDVFIDTFEIAWIFKTMRENPTPEQRKEMKENEHLDAEHQEVKEEYTAAHVSRDMGMALSLHIARGIYIISGDDTLWTLVQVVRAMRVYVLMTYVGEINNDLSTNVKFLAVYKFLLVMISIPHWVACIWWALATTWGNADLPLPSWPAQFQLLSGNSNLDPALYSPWHHYLMSLYMSWAGLISMGYGTLVLTLQAEVIYAAAVAVVHIVFYAFVLGTLLHYLVRTDESTVHFNELMKAVETYVSERKLPAELAAKIRAHYTFQHRKQAAGTDRIFSQMPLSMRTEVAVAQYDRQMHATWVFWNCTPQFLSYLALYLRERHMMPTETLFKRGDGASELPWCVSGSLHVTKGDQLITTIRSDLGPGQIVGEIAFFIGIQQPYTVVASSKGEVTLIVLSSSSFDEIIASYPEQTDQIMQNLLRKYALDKRGGDLASGGFQEQMDEDELKEYEELRKTIRTAIVEHNEELFAQMVAAIKQGDVETVRTLIARGFDPSLDSYDQRRPLHLASIEGNKTIVRVLCELGANVNDVDRFKETPIKNAIDRMHGAVAEELAHNGARLQLPRPAERLHAAAKEGDMSSMNMLVAYGININSGNFDGRTALHVAAFEGNARVAEYLLSNMADVHARDRWEHSPLDDAIANHHPLVAQMLVRNSARPNPKSMAEQLRLAAAAGDTDRLRFLLEMGALIDAKDYDDRAALHYAVRSGSISAAHLLVCALADVNIKDRWMRPPLLDALELSKPVASMLALQCGAKLPPHLASDESLKSALAEARKANMYEINRQISAWTRGNKSHNEKQLERSREVEMAFSELADEMSSLLHAKRTLFRQVGKHADIWINEYAEEQDSDTDSDIDDANVEDVDDADEEDDSDDDDEAQGAEAQSRKDKMANQFIKLVLQLPSAEAGLVELRKLFGRELSSTARKDLGGFERASEEEQALRRMLRNEFKLSDTFAGAIIEEIYVELRKFLGASAPKSADEHAKKNALHGTRLVQREPADEAAPAEAENALADEMEAMMAARAAGARRASATPSASGRRASNGKKLDIVRRGSGTGASLLDFSKQLQDTAREQEAAASRRSSRAALNISELTNINARGSTASAAPDEEGDEEEVFLSDLGHVVLLCSRRFIDELSNRHTAALSLRQSKASSGGPAVSEATEALEGEAAGKKGGMRSRMMRISFTKDEDGKEARRSAAVAPESDASGSGKEREHAVAKTEAVEKATYVILKLFQIFDTTRKGSIRLKDVKRLQGELGEMGSAEIKSLVSYLMTASRAFVMPEEEAAEDADAHNASAFTGRRTSAAERRASAFFAGAQQGPITLAPRRGSAVDEAADGADGLPKEGQLIALADGRRPNRRSQTRTSLEELAASVEAEEKLKLLAAAAPAGAPSAAPSEAVPLVDIEPDAPPPAADVPELAARRSSTDRESNGSQERARQRPKAPAQARSMSEVQFFVGVSSWILLSAGEADADLDDLDEAQHAGSANAAGVPRLQALSLHNAQGSIDKLNLSGIAVAREGTGKAGGRAAQAAAAAAREEALLREIDGALSTTSAYLLLADNIQLRIDTLRLKPTDHVEPEALLSLIGHSVVLPAGANVERITKWATIRLGLQLGGANDENDGDQSSSRNGSDAGDARQKLLKALKSDDDDENAQNKAATWRDLHAKLTAAVEEMRAADKEAGGGVVSRKSMLLMCCGGGHSSANAEDGHAEDEADASARPWYIVSVHMPWINYFNVFFLVCVWWDTVTIPMQLAFIEQTYSMEWLFAINTIMDVVYLLHIALQLHTTFINEKSVEVWRPSEIRQQYLHGNFVLDILASFPHDLLAWLFGVDALTIFSLRTLRMINCRYINAAFNRWKSRLGEAEFVGGLIKYMAPLCLTIHYTTCVWNVIGFTDFAHANFDYTWADAYRAEQATIQPQDQTGREIGSYSSNEAQMIDQYIISLNFVVSILSALGMAQLPTSFLEFGAFIILACINTTVYAWCVGGISGLVMKQDDEIVLKRAQLELVHSYVRHIHVPQELKDRMTKFFQQRLQHASLSTVDSDQIYKNLPVPLQMEVAAFTNRALVGAAALLRGCSSSFLDRLSSALFEREIDPETVVFRSGEACKELILIANGTIEVREDNVADTHQPNEVLGQGDTLGDIPFVFGIRHYQGARVGRTKCNIYALKTDAYRELLKSFPAQEDAIIDNAMRKQDGMATSRSGKSKASGAASSHGGSSHGDRHDARSEGGKSGHSHRSGTTAANGEQQDLHKVLSDAKKQREEIMHSQLCTACAKGDYDKVRRMLTSRSIDIEHGDFAGRRAIHLAACGGDTRVVELLIVGRANVNVEDDRGVTPLTEALQHDHTNVAELLVKYGGRHGSRDVSDQVCTIAADAAGNADLRRLCLYGGNVNASTHEGRTPLHIAASEGCVANAEVLIESGADMNARDRHGSTPLQDALNSRRDDMCDALLKRGAQLGNFNEAEQLCTAAASNDIIHLSRLIRFRCSVNAQDNLGRSALHLAASCRRINVLSLLLDTPGINVNIEDQFGNTPFDDAMREKSAEQQVIVALFNSRSAKLGSHVSRVMAVPTLQVEDKRAAVARKLIAMRETTLLQAKALSKWVRAEREAVRAFQSQVHKALRVEREQGAVLADVHPEFWEQIYQYAENHFDWRSEAVTAVKPMLEAWKAETRDFALTTSQRLLAKFADLCAMSDSECKPIERLYEVTFRKPVKVDAS